MEKDICKKIITDTLEKNNLYKDIQDKFDRILKIDRTEQSLKIHKKKAIENLISVLTNNPNPEIISWLYWETSFCFIQALRKKLCLAQSKFNAIYILPKEVICHRCGRTILKKFKTESIICQCEKDEWKKDEEENRNAYKQEQERLFALKSMPYKDYLQTPEWQERKAYHLRGVGYKCQLCNYSGEIHIHHRTYENRGEERYKDLIALCKDCHQKFHDKI